MDLTLREEQYCELVAFISAVSSKDRGVLTERFILPAVVIDGLFDLVDSYYEVGTVLSAPPRADSDAIWVVVGPESDLDPDIWSVDCRMLANGKEGEAVLHIEFHGVTLEYRYIGS